VGVLAGGEVDLGGEHLGRGEAGIARQQLAGDVGGARRVPLLEEAVPGGLQPFPELRVDGAGLAFQGIDQIRTVGRRQGERLGSPLDGPPNGRRRRRGAGRARRQQNAEDRGRDDPAPGLAPEVTEQEAPQRW
jgi:hypothetical protein